MDFFNKSMPDKPLISVIVPVYNVKEYVGACLDSILVQTYTNTEILLVDDGSTDGSENICDAYAQKDARVRVIHQENKGLSGARNTGLDQAEGEYIAFVDSDDLIKENYLNILYELSLKYGAEITGCLFEKLDDRKDCVQAEETGKEICLDADTLLRKWHGRYKKYETVAWNKLYHRSVFVGKEDIRFPLGRNHEDVLTSHLLVQNAGRIAFTDCALYCYRKREGSIKNAAADRQYVEQNLSAQQERMRFFKEKKYYRSYWNLLKGYVLHRLLFWMRSIPAAGRN